MKITTIVAAVAAVATMALGVAPASAMTQGASSYERASERASMSRAPRDSRVDLGRPARWTESAGATRQGDPADSLYRRAREALNRRNYSQAADLFKSVTDRYPKSESAASAMYFRAFALYQTGSVDQMRERATCWPRWARTTLTRTWPTLDRCGHASAVSWRSAATPSVPPR